MHTHNHLFAGNSMVVQYGFVLVIVTVLILYTLAAFISSRRLKRWPLHRTICWSLGVFCAAFAMIGPLADRAHVDFSAHMLGHLLLGMLAPLLMALAAPITLVLRTIPVIHARQLSFILKSKPIRILSNPLAASFLNIGGLWTLYTTGLYAAMHQSIFLHLFIHIHVFLAGYLFTVSIIYIDPSPHKTGFVYRAIVLIAALAGHGILSKYIYAHPPEGVPAVQAEAGAMLMYYGGDAIDLVLIFILCYQWFKAARPRASSLTM